MSVIEKSIVTSPNNTKDSCAHIVVNAMQYLIIDAVAAIGDYTLHFWIKSTAPRSCIVNYGETNKNVSVTSTWTEVLMHFKAEYIDDIWISLPAGEYWIYNAKNESGDKATDYSENPVDVDERMATAEGNITVLHNQYTDVSQTLTGLSATVAENTTTISQKADQSTVTTIQSNMTQLTADVSGLSATVSSVQTNLADNYSTTAQMNSAISQKADSIAQTVSATYATQSSLGDYETTASATASLALKVSKTDNDQIVSMINASADEITLTANRLSWQSTGSSMTKTGHFTTKDAEIAGWTVDDKAIYKDIMANGSPYTGAGLVSPETGAAGSSERSSIFIYAGANYSNRNNATYRVMANGDTYMNGRIEMGGTLHVQNLAVFDNGISLKNNKGLYVYYNDTNLVHWSGEDLVTLKNWLITKGVLK